MKHVYLLPFLFLALNINFIAQGSNLPGNFERWKETINRNQTRKTESPTLRNFGAIASGIGNVVGLVASFCSHHPFVAGGLVLGSGLMFWRYKNSARSKINQVLELLCMDKNAFWTEIENMGAKNRAAANVVESWESKRDLFAHGNDKLDDFISGTVRNKTRTGTFEMQIADLKDRLTLCNKRNIGMTKAIKIIKSLDSNDYQDGNVRQDKTAEIEEKEYCLYKIMGTIGYNILYYGINLIKFTENFMKNKQIGCAIEVLKGLSSKNLIANYAERLTKWNRKYLTDIAILKDQLTQQKARQSQLNEQKAYRNKIQGIANQSNANANLSEAITAGQNVQNAQQTLALKQKNNKIWWDNFKSRAWLTAKVAGVIVLGAAVYFGVETAREAAE